MGKSKQTEQNERRYSRPPAISPEARENQMISMAVNLAEQQLRDGTASSQIITHYLKLGTMKEQLELEKTRAEVELMKAKAKAIADAEEKDVIYKKAIEAMRIYQGVGGEHDEENIF